MTVERRHELARVAGIGGPVALVAFALVTVALAVWWLSWARDEEAGPAVVLEFPTRDVHASRSEIELPLPPALLPQLARDVEPFPDGTVEALAEARRGRVVLEWWGLPVPPEGRRQPCDVIVVDGEDRPVSGATIEVSGMGGRQMPAILTDGRGRCTITLPHSNPGLIAWRAGTGCSGSINAWSNDEDQPRLIVVPLQPEVRLEGRVVTRDGQPCPRVPVYSYPEDRRLPEQHPQPAFARLSDEQGAFAFELHLADEYRVDAVIEERRSETVIITGQVAQRELALVLPSESIDAGPMGIVVDAQGAPLAGVSLRFWEDGVAHGNPSFEEKRHTENDWPRESNGLRDTIAPIGLSDESGVFRCDGPLRTAGWFTFGGSSAPIQAPMRVSAGTTARKEPLVLRACSPARIGGQLLDPQGKPLSNAMVWALSRWPSDANESMARAVPSDAAFGSSRVPVDLKGRFALPDLHPDARFDIVYEGYEGRSTFRGVVPDVAAGTSDLRIVVGAAQWLSGSIRATVTSASTGQTIESLSIVLRRHQTDPLTPEVDAITADLVSGVRRITGLYAGESCDLIVHAKGFGDVVLHDLIATSEGTPVVIALPDPGALKCSLSADGAPVPWGVVAATFLDQPDFQIWPTPVRSTRFDADGLAQLSGLGPGRWRIVAAHGGARVQRDVVITPGGTVSESFELK